MFFSIVNNLSRFFKYSLVLVRTLKKVDVFYKKLQVELNSREDGVAM